MVFFKVSISSNAAASCDFNSVNSKSSVFACWFVAGEIDSSSTRLPSLMTSSVIGSCVSSTDKFSDTL